MLGVVQYGEKEFCIGYILASSETYMVPSFGRNSLRFTAVTGDWPGCDTSPKTILSFEQLCQSADTRLFDAVRADPGHVTSLPLVTLLASNVSHLTNILYNTTDF